MQSAADRRLLEVFLVSEKLEGLDDPSKAALRLCNKQIKAAIDATIIACKVKSADLDQLPSSNWHLTELIINDIVLVNDLLLKLPSPESLKSSFTALLGQIPAPKKA